MKRVAVFGNAGGGKSTLARELAVITGLPLAVVDELQYRPGGTSVPHEEYLQAHAKLLADDEWIIDGFGGIRLLWERLEAADTLIHVDLALAVPNPSMHRTRCGGLRSLSRAGDLERSAS
jgi:adenylate kinase family enzyme